MSGIESDDSEFPKSNQMSVGGVGLGVEVTAGFVDGEQSQPRLDPVLALAKENLVTLRRNAG